MASKRLSRGKGISKGNPATIRRAIEVIPETDFRYDSGFRYSDRFISVTTGILITILIAGLGGGFLIAWLWADTGPAWVNPVAAAMVTGGLALPLLVSGWLGGSALHKFGGPVGFVFAAGLLILAVGQVFALPLLFWGGIGAVVVTGGGFFYLGYLAGVPMWIGGMASGSMPTFLQSGDPRANRQARLRRTAARRAARAARHNPPPSAPDEPPLPVE